jgi:hypothetical protein
VRVIRYGEHGRQAVPLAALIVIVGRCEAGVVGRTPDGWTAFRRPRGPFGRRRKHKTSEHHSAFGAVVAVTQSPFARSRGASMWSDVRFSDAAASAARDAWEAAVTS